MTKVQNSFQMRLLMEAAALRIEANKLPRGRARDTLLQRADKIEWSAIGLQN
jgi:hypothetical protein